MNFIFKAIVSVYAVLFVLNCIGLTHIPWISLLAPIYIPGVIMIALSIWGFIINPLIKKFKKKKSIKNHRRI